MGNLHGIELPACDVIQCRDREDWLDKHGRVMTTSDAMAALGEDDYKSYFSLYFEKTDGAADVDNLPMKLGRYLEPFMADEYVLATQRTVRLTPYTLCVSREHPWLACTPDALALPADDPRQCEFKTTSAYAADAWKNGGAPLRAQVQLILGLAITGLRFGDLFALIGNRSLELRPIDAQSPAVVELCAEIIPALRLFWRRVEMRDPPPVDASLSTRATLKRLYGTIDEGKEAVIPEELYDKYRRLSEATKSAETAHDIVYNQVLAAMGDAKRGVLPNGRKCFTAYEVAEHWVERYHCAAYKAVRQLKVKD